MKDAQKQQEQLENLVKKFIETAGTNALDSQPIYTIAEQIKAAVENGADLSPYSNLYDAFAEVKISKQVGKNLLPTYALKSTLEEKFGYVNRDVFNVNLEARDKATPTQQYLEQLGKKSTDHTNTNRDHQNDPSIIVTPALTPEEDILTSWIGRAKSTHTPQELRKAVLEIATNMAEGKEKRTPGELNKHLKELYQKSFDNALEKLASGEMLSVMDPTVRDTAMLVITNDANTSLKAQPGGSDLKRSQDRIAKVLEKTGVAREKSDEFTKKLMETHPTLAFLINDDTQQSILNKDPQQLFFKAASFVAQDPNALNDLKERNKHALEISTSITKNLGELKDKSVEDWFRDHAGDLKKHETTILLDVQKDMQRLNGIPNQVGSLTRMSNQLEKLGVDQSAAKIVITEKEELHASKAAEKEAQNKALDKARAERNAQTKNKDTNQPGTQKPEQPQQPTSFLDRASKTLTSIVDSFTSVGNYISSAWKATKETFKQAFKAIRKELESDGGLAEALANAQELKANPKPEPELTNEQKINVFKEKIIKIDSLAESNLYPKEARNTQLEDIGKTIQKLAGDGTQTIIGELQGLSKDGKKALNAGVQKVTNQQIQVQQGVDSSDKGKVEEPKAVNTSQESDKDKGEQQKPKENRNSKLGKEIRKSISDGDLSVEDGKTLYNSAKDLAAYMKNSMTRGNNKSLPNTKPQGKDTGMGGHS